MAVRKVLVAAIVLAAAAASAPVGASASERSPSASCLLTVTPVVGSNEVLLYVVGEAAAPGAVATYLTCNVYNTANNLVMSIQRTESGGYARAYGQTIIVDSGPYVTCERAEGLYPDADRVASAVTCH